MSVTIMSTQRSTQGRWRRRARLAATVLASMAAVGGAGAANAAAATPTLLSYSAPSRLVQSTGNLYWTSNTYNPFSATPYESFVWRASKTNTPGHEIELFSESSTTPISFGDLTYAQVSGNWYGYFVVNNPVAKTSRIERIGLTPTASATVLQSNLPYMGSDDLVTDGSSLYWADAAAVREMPIGGGTPKVLVSGTNFSRVGVDSTKVFYSAGNAILTVPKTGGASTKLITAASTISAMALSAEPDLEALIYGESNGSVTEDQTFSPTLTEVTDVASARAGYTITTVGLNGGLLPEYGECFDGTSCDIDGTTPTPGTPVDVQGDGTSTFWGSNGVYSLSTPIIY